MRLVFLFTLLIQCPFLVRSQNNTYVPTDLMELNINVFTANMYCGDKELNEKQLNKHYDKKGTPGLVFYSINLSTKATGVISIAKWIVEESSSISGSFETGEYVLIKEDKFMEIVPEAVEGALFTLKGSYLINLVRNGSARMYIPVEQEEDMELIFWENCN